MAQPPSVPPGFDEMPVDQQIEYVQSLWDRIFQHDHAEIPSPAWHRREVAEALADHDRDATPARAWEDVQAEVVSKLRSRG